MAARWSSENVVVEFRDAQVGAGGEGGGGCRSDRPSGGRPRRAGPGRAVLVRSGRGSRPGRAPRPRGAFRRLRTGLSRCRSRIRGDNDLIHEALYF